MEKQLILFGRRTKMITKKHFNQIAVLSAKHLAPLRYTNAVHNASTDEKLQAFVTGLADFFEKDNPNFHRGKFINACYNEKK
tara:strand:+ start:173 stop:418 length:246 start_codon:yes stop_codon:yes gene_type:complete